MGEKAKAIPEKVHPWINIFLNTFGYFNDCSWKGLNFKLTVLKFVGVKDTSNAHTKGMFWPSEERSL